MDPLFKVVVLRLAVEDVECIYCWLHERSSDGANRWYLAFQDATLGLSQEPELHSLAPEASMVTEAVRQKFFKTKSGRLYRILFLIFDKEVRILRVRGPGQELLQLNDIE